MNGEEVCMFSKAPASSTKEKHLVMCAAETYYVYLISRCSQCLDKLKGLFLRL